MEVSASYSSPIGEMLLTADDIGLTGAWFYSCRFFPKQVVGVNQNITPIIDETMRWFDIYFAGKEPHFMPKLHPVGTPFQVEVWEILRTVPYGKTVTYGDIALELARRRGIRKMSAQAVGGAVGHNKISVILPCHRVVGTNGTLVGYGGGLDIKEYLLKLEGAYAGAVKNDN